MKYFYTVLKCTVQSLLLTRQENTKSEIQRTYSILHFSGRPAMREGAENVLYFLGSLLLSLIGLYM